MKTIGDVLTFLESQDGDEFKAVVGVIKGDREQILLSRSNANTRLAQLETSIKTTAESLGIASEDNEAATKEFAAKIKEFKTKIQSLEDEKAAIAQEKAALEAEKTKSGRLAKIRAAAEKCGANYDVLASLIPESLDIEKITVGETVEVDGKEIKVWAEESHKSFLPALFPAGVKPALPRFQQPEGKSQQQPEVTALSLATGDRGKGLGWLPNARK